ncbi:MAG: LacI family DNA-binding transcriptional regulator [Actinomycetota bacterium]|nr:LacI family DNA-binding transcriptional regulator [Actinomycetota bacterium]
MTITIGDVAQAAGVSTATVSQLSRDFVIWPSAAG